MLFLTSLPYYGIDHPYAVFSVMIGFEVLFQTSSIVLKQLVKRFPGITLDPSNAAVLYELGPSYVCSMVHCLITGIRGCVLLSQLYYAPPDVQWSKQDDNELWLSAAEGVETTNVIFVGFLLYDLLHVLWSWPRLGKMDVIWHHVGFILCALINGTCRIFFFAFSWLSIGELSTPFLNIRWFLIKSGRGGRGGGGGEYSSSSAPVVALNYCQVGFAITFFLFRVVAYTLGIGHMIYYRDEVWKLAGTKVPTPLLAATVTMVLAGWVLNMVWFRKIYQMAMGKSRQRTKKKISEATKKEA